MKGYKKFTWALVLVTGLVQAQTIKATKESQRVKGHSIEGYAVNLEGTVDEVSASLLGYLKGFAKLKLMANPITTTELVLGGQSYKGPLYATVKDKGTTAEAWLGMRPEEWAVSEEGEKIKNELERLTYEFGVRYYRDKIQVQIDEAVRAQQAVEKQQQRFETESKNLTIKLENNQKEKLQLEKAVEVNKLEYLNLVTKLEQNKKGQDSLAIALEQVKKVVELHKKKQQKVN
jgi:hypothetical protein